MWRAVLDEARIEVRSTRRWRDAHRCLSGLFAGSCQMLSRGRVPDVAAMQARGEKGSSDPTDPRLPHPFPHPQSRKASVICELKLQGVLRGACIVNSHPSIHLSSQQSS